jgi:oligopeptide/dipeptide ABC transporter ATP-binding protein
MVLERHGRAGAIMIELRGVDKSYGAARILRGVDFQVNEGESVAVIGESGSGKTTLSRILLRLTEPGAGSYTFAGQDVLALKGEALRHWRHNVQAVFQNPWQSLNPRLRVGRLLTEPVEAVEGLTRRERRRRAGELLELVGLPAHLVRHYPRELSGGQRQRIAIARAVSVRPRLLVLDEPVSSLDVSLRAQILNLLKGLIDEFGTSVVYVTHDLATVSYICSRAYVLYQGTIMEELSAAKLASQPDNPYTDMLRSSVLRIGQPGHVPARPGLRNITTLGEGCVFADRCRHGQDACVQSAPELQPVEASGLWKSRCHFAGADKPAAGDSRSAQSAAGR